MSYYITTDIAMRFFYKVYILILFLDILPHKTRFYLSSWLLRLILSRGKLKQGRDQQTTGDVCRYSR